MPQKDDKVKHTGKIAFHLPFFIDVEYSQERYGGQNKKVVPSKKTIDESSLESNKGRFVFLRHRIGNWVDSGYGYDWKLITVWLSSFEDDYLDNIEKVVYYLPDSFANPIREKTNRDEKFFTSTAAYGDFNISAEVFLKNDKQPITINRLIAEMFSKSNKRSITINRLINVDTSLSDSNKPLE